MDRHLFETDIHLLRDTENKVIETERVTEYWSPWREAMVPTYITMPHGVYGRNGDLGNRWDVLDSYSAKLHGRWHHRIWDLELLWPTPGRWYYYTECLKIVEICLSILCSRSAAVASSDRLMKVKLRNSQAIRVRVVEGVWAPSSESQFDRAEDSFQIATVSIAQTFKRSRLNLKGNVNAFFSKEYDSAAVKNQNVRVYASSLSCEKRKNRRRFHRRFGPPTRKKAHSLPGMKSILLDIIWFSDFNPSFQLELEYPRARLQM